MVADLSQTWRLFHLIFSRLYCKLFRVDSIQLNCTVCVHYLFRVTNVKVVIPFCIPTRLPDYQQGSVSTCRLLVVSYLFLDFFLKNFTLVIMICYELYRSLYQYVLSFLSTASQCTAHYFRFTVAVRCERSVSIQKSLD